MCETVVRIVLKKEAKVIKCQEMLDWISKNENVESFKVGFDKSHDIDHDIIEEADRIMGMGKESWTSDFYNLC
jgi:hypothetical protein